MGETALWEVLVAREARAASQRRLLEQFGRPLLGLNMNIAGPVKRGGLIDFAFWEALAALRSRLGSALVYEELTDAVSGLEAILVCDMPAAELKKLAMELEDARPVGRLLDLDVIETDGRKLSRREPRRCLVCGGPAAPCARSRAHGLPAVQAAADRLLRDFAAERLAELAVEALVEEVELTPKPGLVDRRNRGAHQDMDLALFCRSAHSLRPYFRRAAELGMDRRDCMDELQAAGLAAESAMLAATGGVNTHRGAVYAFGLVLAAAGSRLVRGGDLFETAAGLAAAGAPPPGDSHGGLARTRYGASGARGEALSGFPHARRAWEVLSRQSVYAALLTLLAEVEDTNLLHRGGLEGLAFVRESAAAILTGPAAEYVPRLEELDNACIARGLSPGGSADLLALALFLRRLPVCVPAAPQAG